MSLNQLRKAASLVALGRVGEAEAILASFERDAVATQANNDLGIAFHQLGNALINRGRFATADRSFALAIATRVAILREGADQQVSNYLAGSHKMRAVVRLMRLRDPPDQEIVAEARREIGEAIRLRVELLAQCEVSGAEPSAELVHDFAMTLNTQGALEGAVRNFRTAMQALDSATGLMRQVVEATGAWAEDLGICLADRVLCGLGASVAAGESPPLADAEACLVFFRTSLASELRSDAGVQAKYFHFLGQAATPTAVFAGRPDRARAFVEAGLDLVDELRRDLARLRALGPSVLPLFHLPPAALDTLFQAGLDQQRFVGLAADVLRKLKAGSAPPV